MSQQLPLAKAILLITLSVVFISGGAWSTWLIYCKFFDIRASDARFNVVAIVQTGPEREALKTSFLAELLDLSVDQQKNIYQFSLKEAQERLERHPIIKQAIVKRVPPGTLYIDYSVRQPIAYLGDYSNSAVDEEGALFPFSPFFSPKRLPELYLDLTPPLNWGDVLKHEKFDLALELLNIYSNSLLKNHFDLCSIDVASAFAEKLGHQQIVIVLQSKAVQTKFIIRLPLKRYLKAFQSFATVQSAISSKNQFTSFSIDFRLFPLIFFEEMSDKTTLP
ncbi:MAG: cell division protein FtsQ/DivIB [Parachlamydiaceae bacterium]